MKEPWIRPATTEEYRHVKSERKHHFNPKVFGPEAELMTWSGHSGKAIANPQIIGIGDEALAISGEQPVGAGYRNGITKWEQDYWRERGYLQLHLNGLVRVTGFSVKPELRNDKQLVALLKAWHVADLLKRDKVPFDQSMLSVSYNAFKQWYDMMMINCETFPFLRGLTPGPAVRVPSFGEVVMVKRDENMHLRDVMGDDYDQDEHGKGAGPGLTVYFPNENTMPGHAYKCALTSRTEMKRVLGRIGKEGKLNSQDAKKGHHLVRDAVMKKLRG